TPRKDHELLGAGAHVGSVRGGAGRTGPLAGDARQRGRSRAPRDGCPAYASVALEERWADGGGANEGDLVRFGALVDASACGRRVRGVARSRRGVRACSGRRNRTPRPNGPAWRTGCR